MRKVVLFVATSLDGFIARSDGGIDWLFTDGDYGYGEFLASIDTALIGRRTYDSMVAMGESSVTGKRTLVFTHSRPPGKEGDVEFVSGDVREVVEGLRGKPGKNLWLVGGGELVAAFMKERLVDELVVSIHPRVLGTGIPLFPKTTPETQLTLLSSKVFDSGLVQLHFSVGAKER